jgi:hypothetical protein
MNKNDQIFNENEHTPLLISIENVNNYDNVQPTTSSRATSLETERQEVPSQNQMNINDSTLKCQFYQKLQCHYPIKFVIINSIFVIFFNMAMFIMEQAQPNRFTIIDLKVISYRTLSGYADYVCFINVLYGVAALFSGNSKK